MNVLCEDVPPQLEVLDAVTRVGVRLDTTGGRVVRLVPRLHPADKVHNLNILVEAVVTKSCQFDSIIFTK